MATEEEAVILEQGSPEAQKIAKAMASATANDILNLLSNEGPLTATDISEKMNMPLTSLKYHLENLLDAGLIEVVNTRWSEKGKQMKIYGIVEKDIIIKPKKKSEAAKIAGKYGVAAAVSLIICAGIPLLSRLSTNNEASKEFTADALPMPAPESPENLLFATAESAAGETTSILTTLDIVFLVIFIVVIAILTIMLILRLSRLKKEE